jgi:hypothetical protein
MFNLTSFSQSDLLHGVTDPVLQQGICVALCDFWLTAIRHRNNETPAQRLDYLWQNRGRAMSHQTRYAAQRAQLGPQAARTAKGAELGLDYEHQTTIMRLNLSAEEIRARLAADLRPLGGGATWTMRFAKGGGHAIAGFHGIVSLTGNIHQNRYHLFDPNLGEYVGAIQDLDAMLQDLFGRFPIYATTAEIRRATEG